MIGRRPCRNKSPSAPIVPACKMLGKIRDGDLSARHD
jgi:hypothetical protein